MCQRDNNPTIEQTTVEGHQQVFNVYFPIKIQGGYSDKSKSVTPNFFPSYIVPQIIKYLHTNILEGNHW